ncbi:MAG TPA: DNA polymerase III subunit alpha, partial [Burkholderiaceae bacterium]|nr:DNA polymerase III subunit alpha [Burkholderiaceae bacterium]
MSSTRFVHLRLHSEFSVVDGIVRIDKAVEKAARDGQGALALTDSANIFGAVRFYATARNKGVKPIVGCDLWITNDGDRDNPFRLAVLVQDRAGYLNLCDLLTRAYLENQHRSRAEVRLDWFEEEGGARGAGLIALSGGRQGDVGSLLLSGKAEAAQLAAQRMAAAFPGRYFLELHRTGNEKDAAQTRAALALGARAKLPVVATHPIQFLEEGDFRAHEARVCIAEGYTLADPRRPRRYTEQQYFKTQAEMEELFADVPVALANSIAIAQRCNLVLELGKPRLPDYPTPAGVTLDDHCRALSGEGLEQRLAALYPDGGERDRKRPEYAARLDLELKTIAKMGFSGYFLIVADFINWAKTHGIPVGPGRGSGAGSLVAYSLGITDLDPLRYELLFERFLNPERVSMPDFDIDFCQDNRDRVIDYVKRKYGHDAVSQIATFGTLGAKAVVRDAGRVLDLPYTKCDTLSKLIPHNPADPWTLDRALEQEPAFAEAVDGDEEFQTLVALARPLEGLTRNVGMHAGGVLIAPGKLTDFCPLYCAQGTESAISQFDKDDIERIGLVKFDFLGLTTLTILDLTLKYVKQLDPAFALTLETLPLDDAKTYDVFKQAATTAIFQFESRGMRELLKRAKPDRLEDLIALNALYRPGPMDLIPEYLERKLGRQRVEYLHPSIEPILSETYGVMVYQEQVMRIAQVVGGYSLGGADLLRRAMGKKKPEEMAKHRTIFVEGAGRKDVSADVATELFDHMEKFAGYGFNKSHSAAYAVVAYQTAYFKTHYPAAFMAANLSTVMDDTDKVRDLIEDCKALGLRVLPPDINAGGFRFEPVDAKTIRYGLGGIKGTGQGAIEAILAARQAGGPFSDLFDLCARVDKHVINRRVVEALVRAGALDRSFDDRGAMLATVGRAIEAAQHEAASAGQASLFGAPDGAARHVEYVKSPRWSTREQLTNEKMALGYYFSGHLFTEFAEEARRLAPTRLSEVKQARDLVKLAGIIVAARSQNTRRGRMGVVVLDDGTAQLELMVFSELYDRKRALLKEDQLLFVVGKVRYDEFAQRLSISAEDLMDLTEARAKAAARLKIEVEGAGDVARLRDALTPYRTTNGQTGTGCRIVVNYSNGKGSVDIPLPEDWRVRGEDRLVTELTAQPRVR